MNGTPDTPLDDAALAQRAAAGQREAFASLVQRHHRIVCALIYGLIGDRARTEELAQESFVLAWQNAAKLQDKAKWRAWVCAIARNRALLEIRAARKDPVHTAAPLDHARHIPSPIQDPSGVAAAREEHAMLHQALESLSEEHRLPIVLYYWENMNLQRVADELDITYDAARQRLVRARTMLRERLSATLERELRNAKPSEKFTAAVLAALPPSLPTPVSAPASAPIVRPWCGYRAWIAGGCGAATIAVVTALAPIAVNSPATVVSASSEDPPAVSVHHAQTPATPAAVPQPAAEVYAARPPAPVPTVVDRLKRVHVDAPSGVVYGQVLDLDNQPVPSATIIAQSADTLPDSNAVATSDADGRWEIVIPEGEYYFRAHASGLAGGSIACEDVVQVKRDSLAYEEIRMRPANTVRGRVVARGSGEPLPGAEICLDIGRTTTTDEYGNFAFNDVDAYSSEVYAAKEGWHIQRQNFAVGTSRTASVRMEAVPGATVSGRIVDTAGQPLSNVNVGLLGEFGFAAEHAKARTNERGEYRITSIPPYKRVHPILDHGYQALLPFEFTCNGALDCTLDITASRNLATALAEQWDIELPTAPQGMFIPAAAAEELTEFFLDEPDDEPIPPGAVAGNVVTPEGYPQPNHLVRCGDLRATTDSDGRFYFAEIPAHTMTAQVFGRGMLRPGGEVIQLTRGRADHVVVMTMPESHLAGTVRWLEDGAPVTDFNVSLRQPPDYDYRNGDFCYGGDVHQVASPDGTFCIKPLQGYRGDAMVFVEARGYIECIRKRVPLSRTTTIDYKENVFYISRREPALTLKGVVIDADTEMPIPGVALVLGDFPVKEKTSYSPWHGCAIGRPRQRLEHTNERGEIRIEDVPTRVGELILEKEGYARKWVRSLQFDLPQRIKLERAATIEGTAPCDAWDGEFPPGVDVMCYDGDTFVWNEYTRVDAHGAFQITDLPAARYKVRSTVDHSAFEWVTLKTGETAHVSL